jgi:hypothetical protein
LLFAAATLYYTYFLSPLKIEIARIEKEMSSKHQKLIQLKTQAQKIDELEKMTAYSAAELMERYQDIPIGLDQAELMVFLEDILKPSGDQIKIEFAEVVDMDSYQLGGVNVTMKTTYPSFFHVLQRLEEAPYRNQIERLRISLEGRGGPEEKVLQRENQAIEKNNLRVDLSLNFYAFPGGVNKNKTYSFMTGDFHKSDLFSQ